MQLKPVLHFMGLLLTSFLNIACKAGVFRCAIDLDFRLTESSGPRQKREGLPAPPHLVVR